MEVVSQARDAQVMADLDACVAWAKAHGGDTRRLGITGFCWGGRIVWMYAAHNPALTAGVAWYGPVARAYAAGDPTADRGRAAHQGADARACMAAPTPASRTTPSSRCARH